MSEVKYGSLPFDEAVRFFRRRLKLSLPTAGWTDLWQDAHDHAFVVAGAMRDDLLADLGQAVDKAISQGTTLEQFRKDFDRIVQQHGWVYKGGRNWRTRVIYETNMRTSYQAGRYRQLKRGTRLHPYWRYKHSDAVEHPRPQHEAWDGLVLRHDDPFWDTHYPPNGWGCKCRVFGVSERQLKKMGKDEPDKAPPVELEERLVGKNSPFPRVVKVPTGIDPGWGYAPGRSWRQAMTPLRLDIDRLLPAIPGAPVAKSPMPAARKASADRVLPSGLPDDDYINAFLAEFGLGSGERETLFEDVAGEFLIISDALFRDHSGNLKLKKRGRERHVLLYADTIRDPDEIWEDWAQFGKQRVLRRRYLARWQIAGDDTPTIAVFETGRHGWIGVTAHDPKDIEYIDRRSRQGEMVWQRKE